MISKEPINLTEWTATIGALQRGKLYTCGRPGRATFGRDKHPVDNHTIDLWVQGLPDSKVLHIVSLLGKKKGGFSEFGYYPFRSSKEIGNKPTFQEWLDDHYGPRFVVYEYPTTDAQAIPSKSLELVSHCVLDLIQNGNTVVVIDSAGAERTARVCEAIGYKPMA